MDHKAFLANLDPDIRAEMTAKSDARGLLHLAGHLGAIVLIGGLIAAQVPGWWALLPVQGVLIAFLFTLEHECTHRTPFANERLNDWVGRVCGLALVLPFEWFRWFHLAHHRWTNLPGKDPELASEKPATWAEWVWHVTGLPFWAAQGQLLAALVLGRAEGAYLPEGARGRIVAEARWMAVIYLGLAFSLVWSPVVLWVWVVPSLLGQPVLRVYLLAEHGDCPQVANMFQNTRTTFTTRMVRAVAWNMPYHVEHHVWPAVPFHKLPQVHTLMRDELRVTAPGYAAFTRAYLERRRRL
jgi:fatty acid desaturase